MEEFYVTSCTGCWAGPRGFLASLWRETYLPLPGIKPLFSCRLFRGLVISPYTHWATCYFRKCNQWSLELGWTWWQKTSLSFDINVPPEISRLLLVEKWEFVQSFSVKIAFFFVSFFRVSTTEVQWQEILNKGWLCLFNTRLEDNTALFSEWIPLWGVYFTLQ